MNTGNSLSFYDPQFAIGEKFKYINCTSPLSLRDNLGTDYFFERTGDVVMEVVGFFPGEKNHEFKVNFSYEGKFKLSKWYFESELIQALESGFIQEILR
jgi:hypothetical protein